MPTDENVGSQPLQCRLESNGLGLDTGFRRYDGVGRWTAILIAMTFGMDLFTSWTLNSYPAIPIVDCASSERIYLLAVFA